MKYSYNYRLDPPDDYPAEYSDHLDYVESLESEIKELDREIYKYRDFLDKRGLLEDMDRCLREEYNGF
jgi:hypothetical protein